MAKTKILKTRLEIWTWFGKTFYRTRPKRNSPNVNVTKPRKSILKASFLELRKWAASYKSLKPLTSELVIPACLFFL